MCVLTRDEILKELESGRLRIEPLEDPGQIGPASVDLHLDREFRVPVPHSGGPIHVSEEMDLEPETTVIRIDAGRGRQRGLLAHVSLRYAHRHHHPAVRGHFLSRRSGAKPWLGVRPAGAAAT